MECAVGRNFVGNFSSCGESRPVNNCDLQKVRGISRNLFCKQKKPMSFLIRIFATWVNTLSTFRWMLKFSGFFQLSCLNSRTAKPIRRLVWKIVKIGLKFWVAKSECISNYWMCLRDYTKLFVRLSKTIFCDFWLANERRRLFS